MKLRREIYSNLRVFTSKKPTCGHFIEEEKGSTGWQLGSTRCPDVWFYIHTIWKLVEARRRNKQQTNSPCIHHFQKLDPSNNSMRTRMQKWPLGWSNHQQHGHGESPNVVFGKNGHGQTVLESLLYWWSWFAVGLKIDQEPETGAPASDILAAVGMRTNISWKGMY